jgi:preprotein translocase subunit YajC
MILTTVYQFQMLGFALSLIIIVASSVYIFIRYQEYKLRSTNKMIDSMDGINDDST